MTSVTVTGAAGFVGQNLCLALSRDPALVVHRFDLNDSRDRLLASLSRSDYVFHLAGVNRPERVEEFEAGNAGSVRTLIDAVEDQGSRPVIVLASSTQAALDNPYGASKRNAEDALFAFAERTGTQVKVFRLPGIFGKWCRPNYNSVVATFCHHIARDLPVSASNPVTEIELCHVDDVVRVFSGIISHIEPPKAGCHYAVEPTFRVTLGGLVEYLRGFRAARQSLVLPDLSSPFVRALYSTYLSYLPSAGLAYDLSQRRDQRGELAELFKSPHFGQMFVSRTRPGVTRGNHYHDSKIEKFCVLEGTALIRFRDVRGQAVLEYPVRGEEFRVVDIPPGYTHSIENVGDGDLVVLFWASEVFDSSRPDTYAAEVRHE